VAERSSLARTIKLRATTELLALDQYVPGFPLDEYTPHGYLAIRVATPWNDGDGGCLRRVASTSDSAGCCPWTLRWRANVELLVMLRGDQTLATRDDFEACNLRSTITQPIYSIPLAGVRTAPGLQRTL